MNAIDRHSAFAAFKHYISTGSILLSNAQEGDLSILFSCFFFFFFFPFSVLSVLKASLMTRIGQGM